jgi:nucleotide-binding universal stress UspA family protein
MFKKILVPLDGTEMAEAALPYAEELAGRLDSDIVLLHVFGPEQSTSKSMLLHYLSHTAEDAASAANQLYSDVAGKQPSKPIEVTWEVISGETAEAITSYAIGKKTELIIMYQQPASRNSHIPGDITHGILKHSPVPVLLVQKEIAAGQLFPEWGQNGIMVPLDGTERAAILLPFAEGLINQRGIDARIILVNIFNRPAINSDYPESAENLPWPEHVKRIQAFFRRQAKKYLEGMRKKIGGSYEIDAVVAMGDPAEEIARISKKLKPDMILMAPHGYSEISNLEYGNVTEKVIQAVNSPVLVVGPGVKAPKVEQLTDEG